MYLLFCLACAVCFAIGIIIGDIAAVTLWIPHAGHHGSTPTILGYIALYLAFFMLNMIAWTVMVLGPVAAAFDE